MLSDVADVARLRRTPENAASTSRLRTGKAGHGPAFPVPRFPSPAGHHSGFGPNFGNLASDPTPGPSPQAPRQSSSPPFFATAAIAIFVLPLS